MPVASNCSIVASLNVIVFPDFYIPTGILTHGLAQNVCDLLPRLVSQTQRKVKQSRIFDAPTLSLSYDSLLSLTQG